MRKHLKGLSIFVPAVLAVCCACFSVVFAENVSTKPESLSITIDYAGYEENSLPVGKTGKTYRVFECVSADENGNETGEISAFVFDPQNKLLPVTDGRFKTEIAGEYRIEYIAKYLDLSAEKTVMITVDDVQSPIEYDFNEKNISSAETGSVIFVYDGAYRGGVGTIDIKRTVICGEREIAFSEFDGAVYFKADKRGEYSVITRLTDFVGQTADFTEKISVSDSLYPVLGNPSVKATCVAGEENVLPVADGILYEDGNIYYMPVKVYFDGVEVTDSMKFTAETAGEHEIKYVCENLRDGAYVSEKTFKITAYENEEETLIFNRHFNFENFEVLSDEDSASYVIKASAERGDRAAFAFDSAIPVKYLDIGFTLNAAGKAYSGIKLIFTDSKNADDRVEINIGKISNGENFYALFDVENAALVNGEGSLIFAANGYADGRAFEGFKSGKAYLSCEVYGISGDVEIVLDTIAGNSVTTATYDGGLPRFTDSDKVKNAYVVYYGKKIIFPELSAYDLFDASPEVTLQITAPDKSVVYSGSVKGGYEFTAELYGNYTVRYIATDDSGNARRFNITVYVADVIPPVIEVSGIKGEVKAGETIAIPEMTVTDNASSPEKILTYVYVYYGNNLTKLVSGSYTFKESGEYKIRFVAYDEYQNYTITEFTVICK